MFTTETYPQSTEVASTCEKWQWTSEAEAKRQMMIELQSFQSQSNKLFGYLNNDDLISIDIDLS